MSTARPPRIESIRQLTPRLARYVLIGRRRDTRTPAPEFTDKFCTHHMEYLLTGAAISGDLETIGELLPYCEGWGFRSAPEIAVLNAIDEGLLDAVIFMIGLGVGLRNDFYFEALTGGHFEIADYLLRLDHRYKYASLMYVAAKGATDAVEYIVGRTDCLDAESRCTDPNGMCSDLNLACRIAVENGHVQLANRIVELSWTLHHCRRVDPYAGLDRAVRNDLSPEIIEFYASWIART